ncbi:MAG: hypothetical protein MUP76_02105, partial [Acidimicrobiia bacterium]|nr:hypothetical protein [Acidimicrobiia bacterium]
AWCEAAPDLEMAGSTVTVAGEPPIEVVVEPGEDAVVLNHTHAAGTAVESFAAAAKTLRGGRGSMHEGDVNTADSGTTVAIRYPIYLDGLNRQTFLLAIRDIAGTADALGEMSSATTGASKPAAEAEPATVAVAPESAAALAEPEPDPEPDPAAAQTMVVDPAPIWAATHTVPGGGISAWAEPDPGLAPIAKLAARVELQVQEQRGAWARVTGSNGWSGWVDSRKLRPLEGAGAARVPITGAVPAAAGSAARSGAMTIRPLALLGGLAMLIAAFLPWNATGTALDGSYVIPFGKPMDWPFAFVWSSLSPGQPRIAIVVLVLALVVLAVAVLPRVSSGIPAGGAAISLLVGLAFLYQFSRAPGWGDTFTILEIGFWVFLVGSVLAAIPYKMKV